MQSPLIKEAAGLYMAWGFYRWRIYSILPLALDTVTRTMADGLLVADGKGFIVGMNFTARELFKNSEIMIDDTLEKEPSFQNVGFVF